jgi:hypothetical protein
MAYQDEADELFGSGGGAPSFKFENLGDTAAGQILSKRVTNQTDFDDNTKVLLKDDGTPKKQLVVVLQTPLRGWAKVSRIPTDVNGNDRPVSEDDGRRTIYVRGWMVGAVGDAVRKAGGQGAPQVGGKLAVRWSGERPDPKRPQRKPMKLWEAQYKAPDPTDTMFEETAPQAAPAQQRTQRPPAEDPWGSPPPAAPAAADPWGDEAPF